MAGGRRRALRLVVTAVGATAAAGTPLFLLGALAVEVRAALGFSEAGLGLAIAVMFAASAAAGPLVIRVIERIGAFGGVVVTAVVGTAALAGIALLVDGYASLLAAMAVAGVAQAFGQPAANGLLARGLAGARQGLAFGVKQSAIPLTSLAAGAALPLVALTVGWRWAFGGAALLVAALPWLVPRHDASARPAPRAPRTPSGPLVLLSVGVALAAATTMSLPTFLVETAVAHGMSAATAGALLVWGSAASIAARLGFGWTADRAGRDPLPAVAALLVAGAPGVALLGADLGAGALTAVVTVSFGLGWGWNGLLDAAVVRRHPDAPAAATGVVLTGLFTGAASGPLGFGALVEVAGYAVAWPVAGAVLLAAAGCVAVAARWWAVTTREARAPRSPATPPPGPPRA